MTKLQEYHAALQPAIDESQPDNIFLFGKTGVGKTAATRFLLDRLVTAGQDFGIDINAQLMNCDGLDTSYRIAVETVNVFRDSDEKISEKSYPRSKVYDLMWETLGDLGGLVILVLDERLIS